MTNPTDRAQSLFLRALEIATDQDRAVFVKAQCGEDRDLLKEVEELLDHEQRLGRFLDPGEQAASLTTGTPITERLGSQIGPYKLLQELGEGGFGIVFMAEQQKPIHRRVALKIIKPGMDTKQVIARFDAERQVLAMMDHPNVAKVLDAGATDSGRPYFVMELVHGVPVTEFCDKNTLTARRRLEMFVDICHAVQHAHQKGIIHRDIKPSNIMITLHDGKPVPKVIDFGVSKATSQTLTEKTLFTAYGQMIGTPTYMSPEQAEMSGLGIDTRSDIYSLGVLLYEFLTGKTPLDAQRLQKSGYAEMMRIIREEEPPRPSMKISTLGEESSTIMKYRRTDAKKLCQILRGELDWIVMQALEKDRNRRYETARDFAADIQRFLNDEAVEACPPSTAYRFRKFVRRNRGPVAAAAALLLMLCLGLAGTTLGLLRAREAEREAVAAGRTASRERDTASQEANRARLAEQKALRAQEAERRLNFDMAFDRGLTLCDQGYVGRGMLWLARALQLAPAEEQDMRRVILANLNAWGLELHSLEAIFPHKGAVTSAAFSPSGKLIVTGSADTSAQLWDAETGSPVGEPMLHDGDVHEPVFSPDESLILTGNYDDTARLWETKTGEHIRTFPHQGNVPGAAFSPDGTWFVTGSNDRTQSVTIRDAESLEPIGEPIKHRHSVHDLAISSDGSYILTACHDKNGRLWDAQTRKLIATFKHETRVITADFLRPDGRMVVTGDSDGNVYLWDVARAIADDDNTLAAASREFAGGPWRHHGGVHRLRVSRDGARILTASFDNTARLWDPTTGAQIGAAFDHQGMVHGVAFSPDRKHVITTCEDNAARLWQPAIGQSIQMVKHDGFENHEAVFTEDGLYMLSKSDVETAVVRNAVTGAPIGVPFSHPGAVRAVAVNDDASLILTGSPDGTAQLWSAGTGQRLFDPFPSGGELWEVDFSPDGARMLISGFRKIVLREVSTGAVLGEPFDIGARVYQAAFSPDGERIVVTTGDKVARLFDTNTGNVPRRLEGHQSAGFGVAFSPDGNRIVTGSFDNTARVWDAITGVPVSAPMQHKGAIWWCVAFSPDGRTVATGCDDWTVRAWDVETAKPIGPALVHEASLIPSDPTNTAVRFDGTRGGINISSRLGLNQGGPWEEKSILLWFQADNVDTLDEQALWEQGGTWRGLNIYIREGDLFVGGWNNQNDDRGLTSPWISGPEDRPGGQIFLSTPISSDQTYQVGVVMAGDPNGKTGTLTGYLNGQPFGQEIGVGRLFEHPADASIGRYRYNTYFDSGEVWDEGTGGHFAGVIDEVAIYNMALPADRIAAQYALALGGATTYDCNSDGMLDVQDLNCTTIHQLAEVLTATRLIQGDADGDGAVGFADFLILSDNFGNSGAYTDGDFDLNGMVAFADFLVLSNNFGESATAVAAVPEPTTALLLVIGLVGFLRRRGCV